MHKIYFAQGNYHGYSFEIREDKPEVGAYLLVYKDGQCIEDHLQDHVQMCMDQAHEDFGVPYDAWLSRVGALNT